MFDLKHLKGICFTQLRRWETKLPQTCVASGSLGLIIPQVAAFGTEIYAQFGKKNKKGLLTRLTN